MNELTESDLQEMMNSIAVLAGEKAHYEIQIRQRGCSCADAFRFHKTGRRHIMIAPSLVKALERMNDPDLYYLNTFVKTMLHEIAHFKECERGRRKLLKKQTQYGQPSSIVHGTYGYHGHKWHTKRFDRIYEKLKRKFEENFGEKLETKV